MTNLAVIELIASPKRTNFSSFYQSQMLQVLSDKVVSFDTIIGDSPQTYA